MYSFVRNTRFIAIILLASLSVTACKKKEEPPVKYNPDEGTYYSIRSFIEDQWSTYHGQPFLISKVVTMNGKKDSTTRSAIYVNWGEIFNLFMETDISDPKFLDKYTFSLFREESMQTRNYYYEAKDPELYTQKLHIATDLWTNKVRTVYIETLKKTFWTKQTRKLLYSPITVIQIQEHEEPFIGKNKDLTIEYRFL